MSEPFDGGRPPRWNRVSEMAVLGAALESPERLAEIAAVLKSGHFYLPAHQIIYDVLLDLHGRGNPTDAVTVVTELTKRGEVNRVNKGGSYLHDLIAAVPTVTNVMAWAGDVIECARIRAADDLGTRILQIARSDDPDFAKLHEFVDEFVGDTPASAATKNSVDRLLAELLDTGDLENIPTLEPLIEDLLFLDSLARLFGPSGSLKSFFALDFAGSVGTGKDWHGRRVRQGTVVYIVAEGVKGVRKRVRAWEQHYGLKMTGVKFLPRPVQVKGPEWAVLIEAVRRLRPVLVIIDTQARVTVGVEENSATEMGVVNELMERLRAACEACVLPVHHSGVDATDRGRGSSSVKGVMQTELSVSRKGKGVHDTRVTLKASKQKDDEDGDELVFALKRIELDGEVKADGSPVTSIVLVPEDRALRPAVHIPATVEATVVKLDTAGISPLLGRDKTRTEATKLGIPLPANDVLSRAVKLRKERHDLSRGGQDRSGANTCPGCGDSFDVSAGHTCPGQLEDSSGQAPPACPVLPPSLGGGQAGQPAPGDCPECGWSLDSLAHDQQCGAVA